MRADSRVLRALTLAAALSGCGGTGPATPAPRWIELARGFQPRPIEELAASLEARVQPPRGGRMVRLGAESEELWFELLLPPERWTKGRRRCEWRTPLPTGGAMLLRGRRELELTRGATTWKLALRKTLWSLRSADLFFLDGGEIVMCRPKEDGPPEGILCRGRLDNGCALDGRWRVAQWDLACDGILVCPGEAETLACEIPPGGVLSFATVSPNPDGGGEELAPATFRIRLDGRTVFEHRQPFRSPLRTEHHRLALGADGPARLSFEVEGEAPALFAAPLLGPAEIGRSGERPWKDPRPDVVLLLCDTFRADNLAAWGGEPANAPELNRLVDRSLRFLDARAVAAWTLPSIGSILTGLFPAQHGGIDLDRGIAASAETLAEVLARQGYRTVAVTDSGLFSRHFAQDQGFEWFEEASVQDWNLAHSIEKARQRLAADDGRPLFLVLHTYRVHGPMRTGPEEDPQPWKELMGKGGARKPGPEFYADGRRFYLDAVRDLDAKLGTWLDELERAGFFERGVVVLTADHGDAHGEHDENGHGGNMYDVKLRVPLAIAGRGIAPRAVPGVVSLIDLAPTVAALAGVEPSPSWPGRSLLAAEPRLASYAFDLKPTHKQVAVFAEGRKLMAYDVGALRAGTPTHAFDLAQDPAEEHNLVGTTEWPAELGRTLADSLEPWLVPAADAKELQLAPELLDQLGAIGYGE